MVGRLLYPLLSVDSPHCPLDGTFEAGTGKVVARCAMRREDSFRTPQKVTYVIYSFTGTCRPERLAGDLNEKAEQVSASHHLTLNRRRDLDSYGEKITSLEEWQSH